MLYQLGATFLQTQTDCQCFLFQESLHLNFETMDCTLFPLLLLSQHAHTYSEVIKQSLLYLSILFCLFHWFTFCPWETLKGPDSKFKLDRQHCHVGARQHLKLWFLPGMSKQSVF